MLSVQRGGITSPMGTRTLGVVSGMKKGHKRNLICGEGIGLSQDFESEKVQQSKTAK
jgi:hypothetical protein